MIGVMMKFCFSVYALLSFGANTKKKIPSHQHCMHGCRGRTLGAKVCSILQLSDKSIGKSQKNNSDLALIKFTIL